MIIGILLAVGLLVVLAFLVFAHTSESKTSPKLTPVLHGSPKLTPVAKKKATTTTKKKGTK